METCAPWSVVARYLKFIGAPVVFGIPGDDLAMLGALRDHSVRMIVAKDQRNAAFMAAGYALARRSLGVCVVGKGPALTNAITGLLEANSLSAPVLLLGVGTGRDRVGANAFQEADQISLVRPVVKWSYRVESAKRLVWALKRAAFLALNDCPGPVYVEIPEDLVENITFSPGDFSIPIVTRSTPSEDQLGMALELMSKARRPLLLVGGGALNGLSREPDIERLADRLGAAIFVTASGRGAVDEGHPLFGGLAGLYTATPLRELWKDADLIVVLGSRLEETATLLMDTGFERPVVQVNLRNDHFSQSYSGPLLLGDCRAAAAFWANALGSRPFSTDRAGWVTCIARLKKSAVRLRDDWLARRSPSAPVRAADIVRMIERTMPDHGILVQENGLLDMWSYFYPFFALQSGQTSITPSEQTSLGFGAAAAVGVKAAAPHRMVTALVGDGAFNIFRSDLVTAADNGLPVTYVILNNSSFGWLEYQGALHGIPADPFRFAVSTNVSHDAILHVTATRLDEIELALETAYLHNMKGTTVLIDIRFDAMEVAPGVQDFFGALTDESERAPA